MASIAAWLTALLPGLAARVLMSLGFGIVTTVGISTAVNHIFDMIWNGLDGATPQIVGLLSLAGVGDALGIITGAISARVAYHELHNAARMVLK